MAEIAEIPAPNPNPNPNPPAVFDPLLCNAEDCSYTGTTFDGAEKHREKHRDYLYKCPKCFYIFMEKGTYYEHYNLHIPKVDGRHNKKSTKKPPNPLPNKYISKNIMHGDIKPYSLLVTSNGIMKIRDVRVSQLFEENATIQTVVDRTFDDLVLSNTQKFLLEDESKSFGKRRVLSGLLKLLENCGLLRHTSMVSEERWFLQLSYYVKPLLLRQSSQPALDFDISSTQMGMPLIFFFILQQIFDSLYAVAHEASLLPREFENTHMITCESVNGAANRILAFIETFISDIRKSKELLDLYLLGDNTCTPPFVVSKQMEQLVILNFREMKDFKEHIQAFCKKDVGRKLVEEILLGHFGNILSKMKEFHSGLEPRDLSIYASGDGVFLEKFTESVKGTFSQIMEAFRVFDSLSDVHTLFEDSSSGNIILWKALSESCLENLWLDLICEKLGRTNTSAVELVHHAGYRNPSLCFQAQTDLKRLHVSIDLILTFGNGLLLEFLTMHRIVAEMTYRLANVFASLYSNGYCASPEEQVDNTSGDRAEDASGTVMGEGAGLNDVSYQINGEDQLLGCDKVSIYARAQDLALLLELKKIGATDAILENTETS